MFDLRYHVASLTAVFVALVIGILVGVGLSGKGFVNDAERGNLTRQIADLKSERDAAQASLDESDRGLKALGDLTDEAYPVLVANRLEDRKMAVLFIGDIDRSISTVVENAVRDAGGKVVRTRSIRVPVGLQAVQDVLARQPLLREYQGAGRLDDLGRELVRELIAGGKTPVWNALDDLIVDEREGPSAPPADGIVVVRSAPPQRDATKTFLTGVYNGVARAVVPELGIEAAGTQPSALPVFQRAGMSTVDSIDTAAGRLALVLLLGGGRPGNYGVEATADDGVLPPISSAP